MATFRIQDTFFLPDRVIIAGKIETGFIQPGMKIVQEGIEFEIKTIEVANQQVSQANAGESVGLQIELLDQELKKKRLKFFQYLIRKHNFEKPLL